MRLWRWLNSLRARLLVGFVIPLVLFLGAAIAAYVTIERLLTALALEQKSQQVIAHATGFKNDMARMAAAERAHHLLGDQEFKDSFESTWRIFQHNLDEFRNLLAGHPNQQARVQRLAELASKWHELAQADFALFTDRIQLFKEFESKLKLRIAVKNMAEIDAVLDEIVETETNRLALQREHVQQTTQEAVWIILGATLLAIVLSLLISLQSARTIAAPVAALNEAAREFRRGRFAAVTPSGPTEIAELARSFDLMAVALSERDSWLQSSERRYRTYVGATSQILWITPGDPACATDFSSWCAFTGQSEQDVLQQGWIQALHDEDRERFQSRWQVFREKKEGSFDDEFRIRRHDGIYRLFSCRAVPIVDAHGNVLEWINSCTDITDREQEKELRREKESAEAANQAKNRFLARMSHELRTPLTTIIGMSRMLGTKQFGDLNDKQADYVADINHAGEHLLVLINEILDLAKIEAGRIDLVARDVAPTEILARIVAILQPLADDKQLTLELTAPPRDQQLSTDPVRFEQVLLNLLANGIKFTPPGGKVGASSYWVDSVEPAAQRCGFAEARGLRIDVIDTGNGIRPQDRELIWNEFQRPSHNGSEGAGIGLALSRKLVELMSGVIWLERTSETGSCFSLILPRAATFQTENGNPH
ncbi:MAG: ATP-binding protein [Gemmataceae bacterium]